MTQWLIAGGGGQLASDLVRVLDAAGERDVAAPDLHELDITDPESVARAVAGRDVVINAAAYTNVDRAESDENAAFRVNATGAALLARACAAEGSRLLHVSTDYVFAGTAAAPYPEDAPPDPRTAYGRTKAAGEWAVRAEHPDAYVVRTSWVYGQTGANFVKTMARLERERETLNVVDDQRGVPTWSRHLAQALVALAGRNPAAGLYHYTGGGETTWLEFARAVFAELGADPERVRPTTTAALGLPAPRPAYSVLSADRWISAGLPEPVHWRDALAEAFATAGKELRGSGVATA